MTGTQSKFLNELAKSKGVTVRSTFGYNYKLTFADGSVYHAPFYDCLKSLGHYGIVN